MAEKVLANPLSGEEIVLAVLDKLGARLRKDCFLSPNLAYDTFRCTVKVSLVAHDVGRAAPVEVEETIQRGDPDDAALEQADEEFEIEPAAPNEIRVETGQDVPVLTKGEDGKPAIKGIKYSRNKAKAAV